MGTSGTESCEACLQTQLKHLPRQLALRLSLFGGIKMNVLYTK